MRSLLFLAALRPAMTAASVALAVAAISLALIQAIPAPLAAALAAACAVTARHGARTLRPDVARVRALIATAALARAARPLNHPEGHR